jgi:hypothetical protein
LRVQIQVRCRNQQQKKHERHHAAHGLISGACAFGVHRMHPFEVLGFGGRLCSASIQYAEDGRKGAQLDEIFLIGWSASQTRPLQFRPNTAIFNGYSMDVLSKLKCPVF